MKRSNIFYGVVIANLGIGLLALFLGLQGCSDESTDPSTDPASNPSDPSANPSGNPSNDGIDNPFDDDGSDSGSNDDSDDDETVVESDDVDAPARNGGWFLDQNNGDKTNPDLYLRAGNVISLYYYPSKAYVTYPHGDVKVGATSVGAYELFVVRPVASIKKLIYPGDAFYLKRFNKETQLLKVGDDKHVRVLDGDGSSTASQFTVEYDGNRIFLKNIKHGKFLSVKSNTYLDALLPLGPGDHERFYVTIY